MSLPTGAPAVYRSADDRIVVDDADQSVVEHALDALGVERSSEIQLIRAFRVARLRITAVTDEQVDRLPGGGEARAEIEQFNRTNGIAIPVTAMDVLLRIIRNRTHPRRLRMGKDRDMDQLAALPHVGGGEGVPVPADPTEFTLLGVGLQQPTGAGGVLVGVLDSAMYPNAALAGRYQADDLVTSAPPRRAWTGHAAFVVGRILLRAPNARVIVRSVLDENGTTSAWDVAVHMADLLRAGVQILNVSIGGWTPDNKPPFLLQRAVATLTPSMVVVAAAGNHGEGPAVAVEQDENGDLRGRVLTTDHQARTWPAALDGVIGVGAASVTSVADTDGGVRLTPTAFTPRHAEWIDAWAPGAAVVSTFLDGAVDAVVATDKDGAVTIDKVDLGRFTGYATWNGTSMSAADVTGEIAGLCTDLTPVDSWDEIQRRSPITEVHVTDVRPRGAADRDWE